MKIANRRMLGLAMAAAVLAACGGDAGMEDDDAGMTDDAAGMAEEAAPMEDAGPVMVADVGLQTPESVLHDPDADVYFVSNINGAPTDEDGNGFISRVTPEGAMAELKWVDGQAEGVTLNAPKGMALKGDTLFVTDITHVRAFDRVSGEPLGNREVPGSTFLNDLAVGPDGTLYVSDSGLNPDFSPSGTDAVYRFEDSAPVVVAEGGELGQPNGLAIRGDEVVVVGFGGARALTVPASGGAPAELAVLPGGQLDGVIVLDDGSLLVSSWETSSVYHVPAAGGAVETVVEGVPSPADIGWDAQRHRVLIPVFNESRLEFRPVGGAH